MRLFIGLAVLAAATPAPSERQESIPDAANLICASDAGGGQTPEMRLKLLAGFGNGSFPVTTRVPEAQRWFDYGVLLTHSFDHEEAVQAFQRARKADPDCVMCVWGEAWASGPTINYGIDKDERAKALALAETAAKMSAAAPERERRLIEALRFRYSDTGGNLAFARAMDEVVQAYPADDRIAVIAADAWLQSATGINQKGAVKRCLELLELVLKRSPDDTAAIHFYIHATEWVGEAGKAEVYADRLGTLAPAAGHLVHMPSHTFFRIGRYQDAADVNVAAIAADHAFRGAISKPGSEWRKTYHGHNTHFALGGALMAGDGAAAIRIADHYGTAMPELKPEEKWQQFGVAKSYVAYGRYSPIDQALAMPDPGADKPAARQLWRYARGEALARKGDAAGIRAEAAAIHRDRKAAGGEWTYFWDIVEQVLIGRAAMAENRPALARKAFERATKIQEAKLGFGGDPPMWWYPIRRSIAAAELQAGRHADAEKQALASLKGWPRDSMALLVLSQAERAQGRAADADKHLAEARKGWKGRLEDMPLALI